MPSLNRIRVRHVSPERKRRALVAFYVELIALTSPELRDLLASARPCKTTRSDLDRVMVRTRRYARIILTHRGAL